MISSASQRIGAFDFDAAHRRQVGEGLGGAEHGEVPLVPEPVALGHPPLRAAPGAGEGREVAVRRVDPLARAPHVLGVRGGGRIFVCLVHVRNQRAIPKQAAGSSFNSQLCVTSFLSTQNEHGTEHIKFRVCW